MLDTPKIEVRCDAGCGDSITMPFNEKRFEINLKNAGWLI